MRLRPSARVPRGAARARARPSGRGVRGCGVRPAPDRFGFTISTRDLDGRVLDDREQDRLSLHLRAATPDYFRTMGMPIVKGRAFEPTDRVGAPLVVVVSESAAALLWPGTGSIGHTIAMGTHMGQDDTRAGGEVIGVVPDVRHRGPGQPVQPTLYVAHAQAPVDFFSVVVRTAHEPSALLPTLVPTWRASTRTCPCSRCARWTSLRPTRSPSHGSTWRCWASSRRRRSSWPRSGSTASWPRPWGSARVRSASAWRWAPSGGRWCCW